MANAGAPESGPGGQIETGAFFGFATAVGIVVAASLAGVLTGGVAIAVVGGLAVVGAFVGFALGKTMAGELSPDTVVSASSPD